MSINKERMSTPIRLLPTTPNDCVIASRQIPRRPRQKLPSPRVATV